MCGPWRLQVDGDGGCTCVGNRAEREGEGEERAEKQPCRASVCSHGGAGIGSSISGKILAHCASSFGSSVVVEDLDRRAGGLIVGLGLRLGLNC